MANLSLQRDATVAFATAAASAARGELIEVLSGPVRVGINRPGGEVTFELMVECEPAIELHARGAGLVVVPVSISAIESDTRFPGFEGALELACAGGHSFSVVLEGDHEDHHLPGHAAPHIALPEVLEAILDQLTERIESHVRATEATTGIPF